MSYIGRSAKLSRKTQEKVSFLATAGQTVATGLAYVPTFVEVILNGSTLTDVTDYTATDGNSITFLGDPLTLNDEVTIISLKTFALADHYNKSEADALLAAKAALASPVFTGPATVNRLSTDGTIVDLQKDGTTVGSIGVASDLLGIGNGTGNLGFFDAKVVPMGNTTGSASNNVIDLGSGGRAFKDAYLSGGVYLGGTGASNKLDAYEEGTWIPVLSFGNASVGITYIANAQNGKYTRIGNRVFFDIAISLSSKGTSTGTARITLPLSAADDWGVTGHEASFSLGLSQSMGAIDAVGMFQGKIAFFNAAGDDSSGSTDSSFANASNFRVSGCYKTNA